MILMLSLNISLDHGNMHIFTEFPPCVWLIRCLQLNRYTVIKWPVSLNAFLKLAKTFKGHQPNTETHHYKTAVQYQLCACDIQRPISYERNPMTHSYILW